MKVAQLLRHKEMRQGTGVVLSVFWASRIALRQQLQQCQGPGLGYGGRLYSKQATAAIEKTKTEHGDPAAESLESYTHAQTQGQVQAKARMLDLKWDQDQCVFVDPHETESSSNSAEFYEKGAVDGDDFGVLGVPSKKNKTDVKATKKRKVRVAPLRTTARKAEDAIYGIGQSGEGTEENQVYVMLACLRKGEIDRAEEVLWKLMETSSSGSGPRSRATAEMLETCLSALLAAQPPSDLEGMLAIVKRFTAYLGAKGVPPARCLAYILHCACDTETETETETDQEASRDKANKVIVQVTYDWTNNYGRKLREVLHHTDILTESDLQRIEGVCFLHLL